MFTTSCQTDWCIEFHVSKNSNRIRKCWIDLINKSVCLILNNYATILGEKPFPCLIFPQCLINIVYRVECKNIKRTKQQRQWEQQNKQLSVLWSTWFYCSWIYSCDTRSIWCVPDGTDMSNHEQCCLSGTIHLMQIFCSCDYFTNTILLQCFPTICWDLRPFKLRTSLFNHIRALVYSHDWFIFKFMLLLLTQLCIFHNGIFFYWILH